MRNMNKVVWGLVLLAAGVIFALNALEITNIDILFPGWWTLFIIIPCLVGLFTEKRKVGNAIGLVVGVALLLSQLGIIDFSLVWKLIAPAVLIVVAIKMIIQGARKNRAEEMIENAKKSGDIPSGFAIFSGSDMNFDNREFSGAELNAIFGGVECDLRGAIVEKDCAIKFSAIFGGVEILVPDNVNVEIKANSIFGGVSDETVYNPDAKATIYISGLCLFGGADIK